MAVQFPLNADFLSRSATYLNRASSWTRLLWIRNGSTLSLNRNYLIDGDPTTTDSYIQLGVGQSVVDNTVEVELWDGTTLLDSLAFAPTNNVWAWIALVYDSGAHTLKFYGNGTLIDTLSVDISTFAFPSKLQQAGNITGTTADLSVTMVREWQATKTLPELVIEAASRTAVITANLLTDTELSSQSDLADTSGNGHNWTSNGAPAYITGPLPPANTTAGTATVIASLPYTQTLDATDAPQGAVYHPPCRSEAQHSVWWQWTCPNGITFLYVGADYGPGVGASYEPYTSVWTGPNAGALTLVVSPEPIDYCHDLAGGPFYFRLVTTPGATYWFQVVNATAGAVPAILTIRASLPPFLAAPPKSFVISDDQTPFPAAIISPTGTYLQFKPFPAGEATATMPGGSVCTQNGTGNFTGVAILDRDWSTIATNAFGGTRIIQGIYSDQSTYFYVPTVPNGGVPYDSNVYVLNKTTAAIVKTLVLTVGVLNAPKDGAPSPDGRTFYVARGTNIVDVWDIASNTLTATWTVALDAGYSWRAIHDGWTISDGSVFFPTTKTTALMQVVRLNPTNGAILNTYQGSGTGTPTNAVNRSCYISDTQFGVWRNATTGAYLQVIDIATGTHDSETSRLGITQDSVVSVIAGDPNCVSNSCPLFVLAEDITPVPPPTDTRTINIRRMRRTPHVNQEHRRVTFNSLELLAQVGTGLLSGQGEDPQVMLRWSDDGGMTWSREHWTTLGRMGAYNTRVIWRRLGQARDRVFEIVISDPVEAVLVSAYLDVNVGLQ